MKLRLPLKRRYRISIYFVSTVLILLAIDLIWVRVWRRITVSPGTTFITAPLKSNAMPDYLHYMDLKTREGATTENNAVIPFFQAITPMGTSGNPPQTRIMTEYFERLGITPPEKAQPLVRFGDFLRSKNPPAEETKGKSDEELFVRTHPWAAADHADVVAWLDSQATLLAALPEMTSRTRWYVPQARPENGLLISVLLPYVTNLRPIASLALTRAMLEIHDGKFAEAQADILACHRFARLSAQGWTVIEYLVALLIDKMALEADITFASAPGLTPTQLHEFIDNLESLPPWPVTLPSSFDTERLGTLDTLIWTAAHPKEIAGIIHSFNTPENVEALNPISMTLRPAHFNAALAEANGFYEQMAKAIHAPTIAEREKLTAQFDAEVHAYSVANGGYLGDPARQIVTVLIPAFLRAVSSHDAHVMTVSLTRISLGLIAFHAENGTYPEALTALKPKFLPEIPLDAYGDQPLHYRKTSEGFLLYSVGPNRADDGGRQAEPSKSRGIQTADDIAIQVPPAEK